MKVRIIDMDDYDPDGMSILVEREEDCPSPATRSLYQMVCLTGDSVSFGRTIGLPESLYQRRAR